MGRVAFQGGCGTDAGCCLFEGVCGLLLWVVGCGLWAVGCGLVLGREGRGGVFLRRGGGGVKW